MARLPIKTPAQKKLEEALEKLKEDKKLVKKKKSDPLLPSGHKKVKK